MLFVEQYIWSLIGKAVAKKQATERTSAAADLNFNAIESQGLNPA